MTQASLNKQFKEYKRTGGTMMFPEYASKHNIKKNSAGIQGNIEQVFKNVVGGDGINPMFGQNPMKNAVGDITSSDLPNKNNIGKIIQDPNLFRVISTPNLKLYYITPQGKVSFQNGTVMSQFVSKTGYNLGTNRISQDDANKYQTILELTESGLKDAFYGVKKGDALFTNKYVAKVVQSPKLAIYFIEQDGTKHKFKTGTDWVIFKKAYGYTSPLIRISQKEIDDMKDGGIIDYSVNPMKNAAGDNNPLYDSNGNPTSDPNEYSTLNKAKENAFAFLPIDTSNKYVPYSDPYLFRVIQNTGLKQYYISIDGKHPIVNGTQLAQLKSQTGLTLDVIKSIPVSKTDSYPTKENMDSATTIPALVKSAGGKGAPLFTNKYIAKIINSIKSPKDVYVVDLMGIKHKFNSAKDITAFKTAYGYTGNVITLPKLSVDSFPTGGVIDFSINGSVPSTIQYMGASGKKTGFVGSTGGSSTGSTTGDNLTFGINNYVIIGAGVLIAGAIGWSVYKNFKK